MAAEEEEEEEDILYWRRFDNYNYLGTCRYVVDS